ncbi:MAG: hypothetical protein SGJ27_27035 [Candidatus Melainabacteria bacterium]|nr:hypothetical protein [Candidatus Melainabacteria bacterium]
MKIEQRFGAVKSFELPDDWIADEPVDLGGRRTVVFRTPDNPAILFCNHFRDEPLSKSGSSKFQSVLYSQFHDLTESEIEDLDDVIEGLNNKTAFSIRQAGTGYLNDRRIIRVRGDWLESQRSVMSCFIDVDGSGQRVQNLYFGAPIGELERWSELADRVFLSIKWSETSPR